MTGNRRQERPPAGGPNSNAGASVYTAMVVPTREPFVAAAKEADNCLKRRRLIPGRPRFWPCAEKPSPMRREWHWFPTMCHA